MSLPTHLRMDFVNGPPCAALPSSIMQYSRMKTFPCLDGGTLELLRGSRMHGRSLQSCGNRPSSTPVSKNVLTLTVPASLVKSHHYSLVSRNSSCLRPLCERAAVAESLFSRLDLNLGSAIQTCSPSGHPQSATQSPLPIPQRARARARVRVCACAHQALDALTLR